MVLVALLILIVVLAFFPTLRCAFFHPFALLWYGAKDLYYYFRRLRFNLCGSGELVAYTGLFGKGKTLSAVHIHHPGEMFLDCPGLGIKMHPLGKVAGTDALNPAERVLMKTLEQRGVWCLETLTAIGLPEN